MLVKFSSRFERVNIRAVNELIITDVPFQEANVETRVLPRIFPSVVFLQDVAPFRKVDNWAYDRVGECQLLVGRCI